MAAELTPRRVTFPSQNSLGDAHGVVIGDPKKTPSALIVVHEWWGMNEQIQEEGKEIARDGNLTVLVPDMYRGKVADNREDAGHLMGGLDWKGAVKDIAAAAQYLKSQGCAKVGVTGFCMGGALSFAAAVHCAGDISAAAPFYGIPNPQLADLTKLTIPVQAHFGELDDIAGFSSPADYNELRERLAAANVPSYEMFTYPAGHGFTNPKNDNYNKEATTLALSRVYAFMSKHLSQNKL